MWGMARSPSNGLRAVGSDRCGKVGSAPTEGLISVLWAQGKAVRHHGLPGISLSLSSAATWPATRRPPPPPLPSLLYLEMADFI